VRLGGRPTPYVKWGLPLGVGLLACSLRGMGKWDHVVTLVSCKVGPSIHVLSSLAIERKQLCDSKG
jgi:hypothetical protein